MSICDTCILNGRCDGRCGDTDPLFYAFEEENDRYAELKRKVDFRIFPTLAKRFENRSPTFVRPHPISPPFSFFCHHSE